MSTPIVTHATETTQPVSSVAATIAQVLREYGQCQRWDWSDFDGRSHLGVMTLLADELTGQTELHDIAWHRRHLDMCHDGSGHWGGAEPYGGCIPETCPTFAAEQAADKAAPSS